MAHEDAISIDARGARENATSTSRRPSWFFLKSFERAVTSIDAEMLSFLGRGKPSDPPPEPSPAPDPPPASSAPPPPSAPPDFSDAKAVTIELVAELEGHDDRVWGMQWEPRGRCLASTSSDKTCRLWSQSAAAGGNWVTVAELEGVHNRTVRQVSWSPCGARARARRRRRRLP